jgi:chromosome segregation ATPase
MRLPKSSRLFILCQRMKNLIGVIVLAVVCIGLAVALFSTKKQATEEKHRDTETILYHSNQWEKTRADLEEHKQVIQNLEKDIDTRKQVFGELTSKFGDLTNKYTDVTANLAKTEAALKASQDEVVKRDAKIAALEVQNKELDDRAIDLSASLTNLTAQIAETQRKLTASEGDKAFLEKELKRLMGEKAELERQFNDLTVLRAQVSKLKEELSIARRLEWIRKGLFAADEQKGAQRLMKLSADSAAPPPTKTNRYELNVEVNADGSVKVIPPLTNAVPAK